MKLVLAALTMMASSMVFSAADSTEDGNPTWRVDTPPLSVDAVQATLEVTEGTWMSLDVSPDGETIVFDLLGDIYRIPFEGGKAIPLRSGHAWEMQPRYSPDGKSIAFTSDIGGGENIWSLDLTSGESQQVTHESFRTLNNPSWSPDGDYIAARKHFTTSRSLGTGEIWLYHAKSESESIGIPLVERSSVTFQKELGEPMFSPDGTSVYYSMNTTPGDTFIYHQDSNKEIFQIRKLNLQTGETSKVVGGPGGAVRPTPSPDSRYIAYVKRVRAQSRLFIMDLDNGIETMLVDDIDQDVQETWAVQGVYPNMDWTPDSKQIVYWAHGKLWRVGLKGDAPVNIPFHVSDTRSIYPAPEVAVEVAPKNFKTKMVRFATPSPNGKSVVFESLGQLFIKHGDSKPKALTREENTGFAYSPVWSPDGNHIYFINWTDESLSTIFRISSRGGKAKQLNTEKGQYAGLSISRDGKTLAYEKLQGHTMRHPAWAENAGIYLMSIRSGKTKFVTKRGHSPQFGVDGRLLVRYRASTSGRDSSISKTKLISMTHDGLDKRELVESEFATSFKVSPDGKSLAFLENHHIYISPLPQTGRVIDISRESKSLPILRLSEIGGKYIRWSADSSQISWSVGPDLKTIDVKKAQLNGTNSAQDITSRNLSQTIASDKPDGTLAIINARLITMNASLDVMESGTIIVEGNRITAVGSDIDIPLNAEIMDAKGKTIIPGLIDAHAHGDYGQGEIVPTQNWNALAHLALGVTTVHNPFSIGSLAFSAAEYARAGLVLSPRIFSTGEGVYGAKSTNWAPIDSLGDALSHIRRLKAQGAFSIKNYNQPRRDQRQQVIEAVRQEGMMTVSEGGSLYHLDMNMIADGASGIEHNVPVLKMYDDVTQFWSQSNTGYTPTLVVTYNGLTSEDYYYQESNVWEHPILSNFVPPTVLQPRSVRRPMAPEADYSDDDSAAAAKVLMEAGIVVNVGAHGQREGLGTHWEMWSFVRGGMSPMQALSTATSNPAKYLGMDSDLGSIEIGKLADLVILNTNVLEDIKNSDDISHVVLNGRVFKANNLEEVVTGDKKLEPFWWHNQPHMQIR